MSIIIWSKNVMALRGKLYQHIAASEGIYKSNSRQLREILPWHDTGVKSKTFFPQGGGKNALWAVKARAYHSQHEWKKKKNQSCTSLCSPRSISQHGWSLFSDCSANKILHPLHLRGLRILWSLWELHLFTKAFAWKLYKHHCTIKKGVLCNGCQTMLRPKCNNFHGLELEKFPPADSLMQRTNCHIYNTHLHTISLQLLPAHICCDYKMQRSQLCSVTGAVYHLHV